MSWWILRQRPATRSCAGGSKRQQRCPRSNPVNTMATDKNLKRRKDSADPKAQVVNECEAPAASVATVDARVAARAAIGARHQRQRRAQLASNGAHAAIRVHRTDPHANPICACDDFFDSAVRGASTAGRRTCRIGTSRLGTIFQALHRRRTALRHHHAEAAPARRRHCASWCLDTRGACTVRLSMIHTPYRASRWLSPDAPRLPVRRCAGHTHQAARSTRAAA